MRLHERNLVSAEARGVAEEGIISLRSAECWETAGRDGGGGGVLMVLGLLGLVIFRWEGLVCERVDSHFS